MNRTYFGLFGAAGCMPDPWTLDTKRSTVLHTLGVQEGPNNGNVMLR